MKRYIEIALVTLSITIIMNSCGHDRLSGKPGSSGKTLEMLIVADNKTYSKSTEAIIDSLFREPQPGMGGFNQPEPRFDIVRITESSFNGNQMFEAHRNILLLEINADNTNKVYLEEDKWSTPQVVIRIAAKDQKSIDSMILVNRERLYKEYYNQEYRRMRKVFASTANTNINAKIEKLYGFKMIFPEEFVWAKTAGSFTWIRKETKDFSLGVFIYTEPYTTPKQFEESSILDRLDTVLKHNVPGPTEGSYMGTERRDFFYTRDVKIGNIFAMETRGLYRCYGDFYGGPFVCYTLQSPDNETLITLFGFVHSPSFRSKALSKRDLLMQVDGICRTISFDK